MISLLKGISSVLSVGREINSGNEYFVANNYWSGSEYDGSNAWNVNLNNGNANYNNKGNNNYVRCVREFSPFCRFYNLISVMNFNEMITAYLSCRKHKRGTPEAISFEINWEENLLQLYHDILDRSYDISPSSAFIVHVPVQREVFAATFRDRIVHHWLISKLTPFFEEYFIPDAYSCRPGRGTLFGVNRIRQFIRECSNNYTQDCWVLKCDLRTFFMSIERNKLAGKLYLFIEEYYTDEDKDLVLWLTRKIVLHDPVYKCRLCCKPYEWRGLPKDKSLFAINGFLMPCERKIWNKPPAEEEPVSLFAMGMPIGNLTSQWFANFYLTPLDKFVMHDLGIKYYGRYVDDFVLVHKDKEYLKQTVPLMEKFLKEELGLSLHPNKRLLQHYSKGLKFLGTVTHFNARLAGKRVKTGMYTMIRKWNALALERPLTRADLLNLRASTNSYLGLLRQMNTYRLRKHAIQSFNADIYRYVRFERYDKMVIKNVKKAGYRPDKPAL